MTNNHMKAVQLALGGTIADMVDGGQFSKCPVQSEHGEHGSTWRKATCSCHLSKVKECPFVKEVQEIRWKRRNGYRQRTDGRVSETAVECM
jgi:hypothetical protein